MRFFRLVVLAGALAFVLAGTALADSLTPPSGKVLLRVSGFITNTTAPEVAEFDREGLEAIGLTSVKTSNPFVKGVAVYEGVLLRDLLSVVGAQGAMVQARALDGYVIDIPVEDAQNYDVLIAMKQDGKEMRVRTKGPLWVIYPLDDHEELKDETFANRSIWQLIELNVKP